MMLTRLSITLLIISSPSWGATVRAYLNANGSSQDGEMILNTPDTYRAFSPIFDAPALPSQASNKVADIRHLITTYWVSGSKIPHEATITNAVLYTVQRQFSQIGSDESVLGLRRVSAQNAHPVTGALSAYKLRAPTWNNWWNFAGPSLPWADNSATNDAHVDPPDTTGEVVTITWDPPADPVPEPADGVPVLSLMDPVWDAYKTHFISILWRWESGNESVFEPSIFLGSDPDPGPFGWIDLTYEFGECECHCLVIGPNEEEGGFLKSLDPDTYFPLDATMAIINSDTTEFVHTAMQFDIEGPWIPSGQKISDAFITLDHLDQGTTPKVIEIRAIEAGDLDEPTWNEYDSVGNLAWDDATVSNQAHADAPDASRYRWRRGVFREGKYRWRVKELFPDTWAGTDTSYPLLIRVSEPSPISGRDEVRLAGPFHYENEPLLEVRYREP